MHQAHWEFCKLFRALDHEALLSHRENLKSSIAKHSFLTQCSQAANTAWAEAVDCMGFDGASPPTWSNQDVGTEAEFLYAKTIEKLNK